jgi:hypothetical protein
MVGPPLNTNAVDCAQAEKAPIVKNKTSKKTRRIEWYMCGNILFASISSPFNEETDKKIAGDTSPESSAFCK